MKGTAKNNGQLPYALHVLYGPMICRAQVLISGIHPWLKPNLGLISFLPSPYLPPLKMARACLLFLAYNCFSRLFEAISSSLWIWTKPEFSFFLFHKHADFWSNCSRTKWLLTGINGLMPGLGLNRNSHGDWLCRSLSLLGKNCHPMAQLNIPIDTPPLVVWPPETISANSLYH